MFGRLSSPAKTRGASEFKLGGMQTTGLSLELTKFGAVRASNDGHHSIEGNAVAFVAYASDGHKWPRDCCNLDDGLQVTEFKKVLRVQVRRPESGQIEHNRSKKSNLSDKYDPELIAEIDSIRLGIADGLIAVPRIEFLERAGGSF